MLKFLTKSRDLVAESDALPGRDEPIPVPDRHDRARHAAPAAVPRGHRGRAARPGLLLGRRAPLLAAAGRLHDGGRLRRRLHEEPDLRRGLLRPHRPHRGRARRLRPEGAALRAAPAHVLGGPRPDAGHAPGQRHGHPVPLGALLDDRRAARDRRCARATPTRPRCPSAAAARSRRSSREAGAVLPGRGLPPAVPAEEPGRLLRPRRHGRELPDRRGRQRSSDQRVRRAPSLRRARQTATRPPLCSACSQASAVASEAVACAGVQATRSGSPARAAARKRSTPRTLGVAVVAQVDRRAVGDPAARGTRDRARTRRARRRRSRRARRCAAGRRAARRPGRSRCAPRSSSSVSASTSSISLSGRAVGAGQRHVGARCARRARPGRRSPARGRCRGSRARAPGRRPPPGR